MQKISWSSNVLILIREVVMAGVKIFWGSMSILYSLILILFVLFSDPSKIDVFNVFKVISVFLSINGILIFIRIKTEAQGEITVESSPSP